MSLQSWADRMTRTLDNLRHPLQGVQPPPSDVRAENPLGLLLAIRTALGVDDRLLFPAIACAESWAQFLPPRDRDGGVEKFYKVVAGIDDEIVRALDKGGADDRLLRTADFQGILLQGVGGLPPRTAVGKVNTLPADHPLRKVPADDMLQSRDGPLLVLGLLVPNANPPRPRPFYMTKLAMRLTGELRREQRFQEADRERLDGLEQQRRRALHAASVDGKLENLQEKIAELEKTKA